MDAVRQELKQWEKAFKAREGRAPSKADIKANPVIAEKYRLYSKSRVESGTAPTPSSSSAAVAAPPPITPQKHRIASTSNGHDTFKTPSRPSASKSTVNGTPKAGADLANGNGAVNYAFAPSPSKLRALAASRSFSGSPNRKPSTIEYEGIGASPRNLGRTIVVPPADTPRTKARRWLNGDAVSPPFKNKARVGDSQPEASDHFSQTINGKPGQKPKSRGDFWKGVEQARQNGALAEEVIPEEIVNPEDDDFMAPSPVKARNNGKGKQRADLEPEGEALAKPVKPSFFSAGASIPEKAPEKPKYVAGPSKPKKRTIGAAALVPVDNLGELDVDDQGAPANVGLTGAREKVKSEEPAVKKRTKRESAVAGDSSEAVPLDENSDPRSQADAISSTSDTPAEQAGDREDEFGEDEDDYDVRDLDEYEPYDPQARRSKTPAVPADVQDRRATSELDESLDPSLVSLLSLKTSPVKNRLAKLHKKRDTTVQKLLQEPTYLIAQKKAQAMQGLEDLEDDEYLSRRRDGERDDASDDGDVAASDDEKQERLAENSDDDWASEPDGWKDLGDGEMDYDDL